MSRFAFLIAFVVGFFAAFAIYSIAALLIAIVFGTEFHAVTTHPLYIFFIGIFSIIIACAIGDEIYKACILFGYKPEVAE
jgi:hypothetical protein